MEGGSSAVADTLDDIRTKFLSAEERRLFGWPLPEDVDE
jgi:hypothetical protein